MNTTVLKIYSDLFEHIADETRGMHLNSFIQCEYEDFVVELSDVYGNKYCTRVYDSDGDYLFDSDEFFVGGTPQVIFDEFKSYKTRIREKLLEHTYYGKSYIDAALSLVFETPVYDKFTDLYSFCSYVSFVLMDNYLEDEVSGLTREDVCECVMDVLNLPKDKIASESMHFSEICDCVTDLKSVSDVYVGLAIDLSKGRDSREGVLLRTNDLNEFYRLLKDRCERFVENNTSHLTVYNNEVLEEYISESVRKVEKCVLYIVGVSTEIPDEL